jgi:transposase
MARGPKAIALEVSEVERRALGNLIRRRKVGQALAQRARVVLACAEPGATNLGVARVLGVSRPTVALWRRRFAEHRLEGLVDAPRAGVPRQINDQAVERLIALTLEEMPANATHWSTRSMARRAGMSQTAVSRIWRAFGLRPHRMETFKLSTDPAFVEKVRDVVGLYLNPPDRALVLCVDEKPQIQALRPTAPILPLRPGQSERRTHEASADASSDPQRGRPAAAGGGTIGVAARPTCSRPWTSGLAPSSAAAIAGTAASSSAPSSTRSRHACRRTPTSMSCSTMSPPTRPGSSRTG